MRCCRYALMVLLLSLSACSKEPSAQTTAATPDERQQRELELMQRRDVNRQRPAFTSQELRELMADPMHKAHLALWREQQSYYALLEIAKCLEARIC